MAGCLGDGGSGDDESNNDGSGDDGSGDDGSGDDGMDDDPYGGHLRVAFGLGPNQVNPFTNTEVQTALIGRWAYSWLTWLDTDLEPNPHLATDWEPNEAGDQWTFELRDDAVFHHSGNTVIADDVKASFDAIYGDDIESPGAGNMGPIDTVDVVNDQRVQFNLENPFVEFPRAVSLSWAAILPQNIIESRYDEVNSQTFGSGPFVLDEFDPGTELTYERADGYYLADDEGNELPYLDRITVTEIADSSAKISALQSEEVDAVRTVGASQWERTANMDGVETYQQRGGWQFPIILRNDTEPFTDTRVIQAFKYALNQEEILSVAHGSDLGYPAPNHGPVPPISPNMAEDLKPDYGTNAKVDKARELLSEAGYENGLDLQHTLQVPSERAAPVRPQAVNFQSQMADAGIEFDLQEVTWDTFLADIETQHPFYVTSLSFWEWTHQALFIELHPDGFLAGNGNWSEEYNQVVEDSIREPDEERRTELYKEAQRIAHREAGFISPFYVNVLSAARDDIQGYTLDPLDKKYFVRWMHIDE
jgi:peptide/nickel transport system substrate-binding protein